MPSALAMADLELLGSDEGGGTSTVDGRVPILGCDDDYQIILARPELQYDGTLRFNTLYAWVADPFLCWFKAGISTTGI